MPSPLIKVRHPKPPSQAWRTFRDNHVGCLVSIDFFVDLTATFAVLFIFIALRVRPIEHLGVNAALIIQAPALTPLTVRKLIEEKFGAEGSDMQSALLSNIEKAAR